MKGVHFEESTDVLTRPSGMTEEQCGSLPIYRTSDGHCISCWELSDEDLETLRRTKRGWLWVWSGKTQPPVSLSVESPFEPEPAPERPPVDPPEPPRRRMVG